MLPMGEDLRNIERQQGARLWGIFRFRIRADFDTYDGHSSAQKC